MHVFQEVLKLLSGGEDLVLATILSRSGSAPRAVGTRMAVRSDASIVGTIGGGALEAEVQNLAKSVFGNQRSFARRFMLTEDDATRMGMICGGELEVLIQFLNASDPMNVELHRALVDVLTSRKSAWLITEAPSEGMENGRIRQQLAFGTGGCVGDLDAVMGQQILDISGVRTPELVACEGSRFLIEPLCSEGEVYIFGAGHISRQLALLTKMVGFRTVVLDDREEFANRIRFETADEVLVLDSFEDAMQGLHLDHNGYIVLVTRGHAYDKTLLAQALRTNAGYIGMIGSRRKRDAIYEELRGMGFAAEAFERVYSPIGLDIGAETPEEIAVSIAAELVRARAGGPRR
ncbi:MAG: XdhC family aldehyde oxidoreductase maturation factor [Syntrophobacteraceae bacterium]